MDEAQHPKVTRRDAVAGIGAATLLGALAPPATAQNGTPGVTGIIFEDLSGTGRRQAGDPGIAGVLVSNGRDVARSDGQGRYSLPIIDDMVVSVIKPAGYALPLDDNNLPRLSYVHAPTGSPAELGLRYRGLDPTGPLPDSVDFGLTRADEPARFDVILFTDPQPESHAELDFVRDAVLTGAIGTKAAFGLTTGDIMFDDLSLYPRYNRMIGRMGLPWYNLGGNHDLNFEAPDRRYSRETFKRVYGAPYYAFNYGQTLFLMLDNVAYLGANKDRPGRSGKYEGRIGEQQLAFVANVLKETPLDRLVVVAMHIPLRNDLDAEAGNRTADRAELFRLLGTRPVFSVAGHTHTTEHHYFDAADGVAGSEPHHHHILTAVSGSWWSGPYDRRGIAAADSRDGTPNGFHVLSIDGARYTTRYVPANEPNERQMRISLESQFHSSDTELHRDYRVAQLLGSPIPAEAASATNLVVNVFDGGPKTLVTARIGTRPPIRLVRTRRPDPFVEQIFSRNQATKKSWVKAEPSSHIWTSRLPGDMPAGTHRIDIEASDEYGRTHRDHLVLELVTGGDSPNRKI